MSRPFGYRIFVKVDTSSLENIGTNILNGEITDISDIFYSMDYGQSRDAQVILFKKVSDLIEIGDKVSFVKSDAIDILEEGIYNVPIELVRRYEIKEYD